MDFKLTLGLLAAFVAVSVFCGWRGALPSQPARGVRMIPWRPLMVAFAVGAFIMLIHLANLAGFQTGR
jgi:hypothetical protein